MKIASKIVLLCAAFGGVHANAAPVQENKPNLEQPADNGFKDLLEMAKSNANQPKAGKAAHENPESPPLPPNQNGGLQPAPQIPSGTQPGQFQNGGLQPATQVQNGASQLLPQAPIGSVQSGPIEAGPALPIPGQSQQSPKVDSISKYNLFGGAPPVPGTRRVMADGEAPEDYLVEPGDTLFDIGAQLLDEPGYWPKLWALNPEITNPHFIYPGMHLRFYPGDDENPPYLEVITEDDVIPIDKNDLREEELVAQDISGLLMDLSDRPPTPVVDGDNLPLDESFGLETTGNYYQTSKLDVILPVQVISEDAEALGSMVLGPSGGSLLAEGQKGVFQGKLNSGAAYLILRPSESIYAGPDENFIGQRFDVVGTVSIEKSLGDDQYLGTVQQGRLGVMPEDLLFDYRSIKRTVDLHAKPSSVGSTHYVVGFDYADRIVGGEGDFVLFDQTAGKLVEGQSVSIYQPYKKSSLFFDIEDFSNVGEPIALVYIVDTSSAVAIGYCLHSNREIRIGDTIGPPP